MTPGGTVHVQRVVVPGRIHDPAPDYVDVFDLTVDEPLGREVEDLTRVAMEQAPRPLPHVVRLIHRHVLRFDLAAPGRAGHLLGWRIVGSTPERLRLETSGPLMAGTVTVETRDAVTTRLTTSLVWARPRPAATVWRFVGPIHRVVAPRLMVWAARTSVR